MLHIKNQFWNCAEIKIDPLGANPTPVAAPVSQPVAAPVPTPVSVPVASPVAMPVAPPSPTGTMMATTTR